MNAETPSPQTGPSPPAGVPYQLRSEDFEHIWLRTKDRYWRLVFAGFGVTVTLGASAGYVIATQLMDRYAERAVKDYAQTEAFKNKIAQVTRDEVPALSAAMLALEQRETQLGKNIKERQEIVASMEADLLKIKDNSVVLTTSDGQRLHLEYGQSSANQLTDVPIKFKISFARPPTVLLTAIDGQPSRSPLPLTATHVSLQGFSLSSYGTGGIPSRVDWMAIGQ